MKKSISLLLVLIFLFTQSLFAEPGAEKSSGEYLKKIGVILGDGNGNLGENQKITREQALLIMLRLMDLESEARNHVENHGFKDVPSGNYYGPYIAYAKEHGFTKGISEEKFGLGLNINAEAVLSYMLRAFGNTADWSKEDIFRKSASYGLLKELNTKRTASSTRGEVFVIMNNAISNLERTMGYKIASREEYETAIGNFNKARKSGEPLNRDLQLAGNLKDMELLAAYPKKGNEIRLVFRQKKPQNFTPEDVIISLEDSPGNISRNMYTSYIDKEGDGYIRFKDLSLFDSKVRINTLAGNKVVKFGKAPDFSEPEVVKSSTRLNRDIILKFNDIIYSVGESQFIGRDNFSIELDGEELDMNNFSVAPTSKEVTLTQLSNKINLYNKTVVVKYKNLARSFNFDSETYQIPMSDEKSVTVGFDSVDHPKFVGKTTLNPREYVLNFERLTYGEAKDVSVYVNGKKLEKNQYGVSSSGNNVFVSIRTEKSPKGKVEIEYENFIDVATQVKSSKNKVLFDKIKSDNEEINASAEKTGKLLQNVAKGKEENKNTGAEIKDVKIPKYSYDISDQYRMHRIYFDDVIQSLGKENIKYRTKDGVYLDNYELKFISEDENIYGDNGEILRTIRVNYALITLPKDPVKAKLLCNLKDGFSTKDLICELHGIKDKKTGGEMPYMEFKIYYVEVIN